MLACGYPRSVEVRVGFADIACIMAGSAAEVDGMSLVGLPDAPM